jgi:hypothetical protein
MVLSQETIMSLKPEQVLQIEGILKAALPEPGNNTTITETQAIK